MKVLVVDAHLGTRQKIREIVLADDVDHEVDVTDHGGRALDMIGGGNYDVIITSNHLDQFAGANLLQGIYGKKPTPQTLLHSSHARGYMLAGNNGREEINLAEFTEEFFGRFAQFKLKDREFSYIAEFILDVKIVLMAKSL